MKLPNLKLDNNKLLYVGGGIILGVIAAQYVLNRAPSTNVMAKAARYHSNFTTTFPHYAYLNTLPSQEIPVAQPFDTWRIQTLNGLADKCNESANLGPPLNP